MSSQLAQLQEATIKQHCKTLRMPMMGRSLRNLVSKPATRRYPVRDPFFSMLRRSTAMKTATMTKISMP